MRRAWWEFDGRGKGEGGRGGEGWWKEEHLDLLVFSLLYLLFLTFLGGESALYDMRFLSNGLMTSLFCFVEREMIVDDFI